MLSLYFHYNTNLLSRIEYYHFLTKIFFSGFIKNTMLRFPPIKPKKLPECLIYKIQNQVTYNKTHYIARIISLKEKTVKGEIVFYPSYAYRKGGEREPSIFIYWLKIFDRKKGYGTKLLNYIKNYSKQIGCKGNFWLDSSACLLPNEAPHTFYRKYGMTSDSKKTDKLLDKFIKKNKIPTYKDMPEILMYYPEHKIEKKNIFKRIWNKLFFK